MSRLWPELTFKDTKGIEALLVQLKTRNSKRNGELEISMMQAAELIEHLWPLAIGYETLSYYRDQEATFP